MFPDPSTLRNNEINRSFLAFIIGFNTCNYKQFEKKRRILGDVNLHSIIVFVVAIHFVVAIVIFVVAIV